MKSRDALTAEELRRLFHYDRKTGQFTYRVATIRRSVGQPAGKISPDGYVVFSIKNRSYRAHLLAWLYVHGEWSEQDIDHKNLDRSDTRFDNLRAATRSQNCANSRVRKHSATGLKGVYLDRKCGNGKYAASIGVRGKRIRLGYFHSKEDAHAAYAAAASEYFGEFARAA